MCIRDSSSITNEASSHSDKIIDPKKKPNIPDMSLVSKTSESVETEKTYAKSFPKRIGGERKKPAIEMQKPTCSYKNEDSTNLSNEFTESGSEVKGTKSIDSFRPNMISDLMTSIEDEDTYTKILKNFIDAEKAHKAGKCIDTFNYNYDQLKIDTLPNFIGCSERKLAMRTSKLKTLLQIQKDTESYKIHFDQFVDMEENFVENGCK